MTMRTVQHQCNGSHHPPPEDAPVVRSNESKEKTPTKSLGLAKCRHNRSTTANAAAAAGRQKRHSGCESCHPGVGNANRQAAAALMATVSQLQPAPCRPRASQHES